MTMKLSNEIMSMKQQIMVCASGLVYMEAIPTSDGLG